MNASRRSSAAVERPAKLDDGIANDIRNARILIVDDSPAVRKLIAGYLRADGFVNLAAAGDGRQGLEMVRAWHPELIITDLLMPNVSGFELCRDVRSDPATSQIPILVETGAKDAASRAEAFFAGATDLITKPINARELLGRMRVHLERRRLIEDLSEFRRCMRLELEQARAMQESLLPADADMRLIEARYPVSVGSHYEASTGLGGDIWGIDAIDESRLKVFCADFSGHGVGAALNTFRLHSFIASATGRADDAATWLERLNLFLCDVLPLGQFATMFCGVLDFSAGTLNYASAGAPSPIVLSARAAGGCQPHDGTGFPLGITAQATYENRIVPFDPGSTLFLYSDALIETPDMQCPVFTVEGLCAFLSEWRGETSPAALQNAVLQRLYAGTPENAADDLTIVTLRHEGATR